MSVGDVFSRDERERVLDRIDEGGEKLHEVAADVGVPWQTIAAWRRHLRPGSAHKKRKGRPPREVDPETLDLVRALLHASDCGDSDCERCANYLRWAEEHHAGVVPAALHKEHLEGVERAARNVVTSVANARTAPSPSAMAETEAALRELADVLSERLPIPRTSALATRPDPDEVASLRTEREELRDLVIDATREVLRLRHLVGGK